MAERSSFWGGGIVEVINLMEKRCCKVCVLLIMRGEHFWGGVGFYLHMFVNMVSRLYFIVWAKPFCYCFLDKDRGPFWYPWEGNCLIPSSINFLGLSCYTFKCSSNPLRFRLFLWTLLCWSLFYFYFFIYIFILDFPMFGVPEEIVHFLFQWKN